MSQSSATQIITTLHNLHHYGIIAQERVSNLHDHKEEEESDMTQSYPHSPLFQIDPPLPWQLTTTS
jgi:hypothetical protein